MRGRAGRRLRPLPLVLLLALAVCWALPVPAAADDAQEAEACVARWLAAPWAGEASARRDVEALGVAALAALRAAAATHADAAPRIARLRAGIVERWQRAQVPPGMVFVPAGMVVLPRPAAPFGPSGERAYVPAFYIDRTEVTVAAWRAGCLAHGLASPREGLPPAASESPLPPGVVPTDDWPAAGMTQRRAEKWAAVVRGGRLPTVEEFGRALRGSAATPWPWGDDPPGGRANLAGTGPGHPRPVGSHPAGASPFGVLDLVGNVAEWSGTCRLVGQARGRWPYVLGGSYGDAPGPGLTWCGHGDPREPQGDTAERAWIGLRVVVEPPWPPGEGPAPSASPGDEAQADPGAK
jgi:formylglycine-generating enzyme required for sulfatase activity